LRRIYKKLLSFLGCLGFLSIIIFLFWCLFSKNIFVPNLEEILKILPLIFTVGGIVMYLIYFYYSLNYLVKD